MNRSEFEHIIRAASVVTQEKEFIVIGSQAILGKMPDAPRTLRQSVELDLYPRNRPELANLIDGSLGELSAFHQTHKIYAHGIGPETAVLPSGWEKRLVEVKTPNMQGAIAWCLEPHDLAYSKLAAGREKDLDFVAGLKSHHVIRPSQMESLIATADLEWWPILSQRWTAALHRKPEKVEEHLQDTLFRIRKGSQYNSPNQGRGISL